MGKSQIEKLLNYKYLLSMGEIWHWLRAVVTCYPYVFFILDMCFFISPSFTLYFLQKISWCVCPPLREKQKGTKKNITHPHTPYTFFPPLTNTSPSPATPRNKSKPFSYQVGSIAWKILRALGPQKVVGVLKAPVIQMECLDAPKSFSERLKIRPVNTWNKKVRHMVVLCCFFLGGGVETRI